MYEHNYDMYLTLYGILQTSCLRCVHEPVHVQTKLERGEERRGAESAMYPSQVPSALHMHMHMHMHMQKHSTAPRRVSQR